VLGRLTAEHCTRLELVWADSKYHNHSLYGWLEESGAGYRIELIGRPKGSIGFVITRLTLRSPRLEKKIEIRLDPTKPLMRVCRHHE
jgi:putative transposase